MKIFNVLKPGLFTTVQDLGRFGCLRYGIPISGAMDTVSLIMANVLVGNSPCDACLETTLLGPELQALTRTQIAVTGGTTSLTINDDEVPMWQTIEVQEGDLVSFGKMESGCRGYLAVRGGIDTPSFLGSRSTYVRGKFGGINGRQLKTGDAIKGSNVPLLTAGLLMPEELRPQFAEHYTTHVILGPQKDMFTEKGLETFLSCRYMVTLEADRMGYRLEGPMISHKVKAEIVSDALLAGGIQVPRSGQPIIIMRDAQTTGGYPKIAVAITPDICLLGQAKPGDTIEFEEVQLQEAHEKTRKYHNFLNNLKDVLVSVQ